MASADSGHKLAAIIDTLQGMSMTADDILALRLHNHHLTSPLDDPARVVANLGAVQSQDVPAALWALGLRLRDPSQAKTEIEQAFADGRILRTHVLRPTWHFVAPADIRWLLQLTAPRIKAATKTYRESIGVTDALIASANKVIQHTLRGRSMTRAEIGSALRQSGIEVTDGGTLAHIIGQAELDALVCSGPSRGKDQTYMLIDERVPAAPHLTHDEQLAELTWRYFSSHGPAHAHDCAWWSGLTVSEVKRGLELNRHRLLSEEFDGRTYWFRSSTIPALSESAYLLPNYDEYTVAYRHRDLYYDRALNDIGDPRRDVPFTNVIVLSGRVVGRWDRALQNNGTVAGRWSIQPSTDDCRAFDIAAARYAAFHGLAASPA